MGMDVSGINPVIRSKAPERPENLWDLPDEEKDAYFDAREKWSNENPGDYFRANVWSWRPIMEAMWESGACNELSDKDWERMQWNDGAGAPDQATCDRMVLKLKAWMMEKIWDEDTERWTPESLENEKLMVNVETGQFINKAEAELKDVQTKSPYSVHKEHLEGWIRFLSECGGFEVW